MEIIRFTFNAVVPLFIIIAIGYFLKAIGLMPEDLATRINKICFSVMIPCNLFKTTYYAELSLSSIYLVGYALACYLVIVPILCRVIPKIIPSRPQAGSVIQSIFRSNMVLLGIPLMTNLFGEENVTSMALLITILVPLYNVIGVIVLTIFSSSAAERPSTAKFAKNIAKNPLIIAAVLGIVMNLLHVPLPSIVTKPLLDLSAMASPLAMMALGACFNFKTFQSNRLAIAIGTAGRLVVMPFLITAGGVAVGFRGAELCALFICSATPAAVASVAMADAMGCDAELAGEIMITTSALSSVTLFLELCLLQALGLM